MRKNSLKNSIILINLAHISTALGITELTVTLRYQKGHLPPPSFYTVDSLGRKKALGWLASDLPRDIILALRNCVELPQEIHDALAQPNQAKV